MKYGIYEGDVVYNEYHGIRRYGIVDKKEIADDGWAYCEVEWFSDEQYVDAMEYRKKLTKRDYSLKTYRVDFLKRIDLQKELQTLKAIECGLNTRGKDD
jgi:hypothetical protein